MVEQNSYHLYYLPYYTFHGAFSYTYGPISGPNDHSKRYGKLFAKDDQLCCHIKQDHSWDFARYGDGTTAVVSHRYFHTNAETFIKLNIRYITCEVMYHYTQVLECGW